MRKKTTHNTFCKDPVLPFLGFFWISLVTFEDAISLVILCFSLFLRILWFRRDSRSLVDLGLSLIIAKTSRKRRTGEDYGKWS